MTARWKDCPKSWNGQHHNSRHEKHVAIVVEAISDSNLYSWHLFVGRPGVNKDKIFAENLPLFTSIFNGTRTTKQSGGYVVGGIVREWYSYFLVNDIYPG